MNEVLPVEIIEHIFRFLPDQGVVFVCYDVCRWWRSIVHNMQGLSIVKRYLEKKHCTEIENVSTLTDDDLRRVKYPVAIVHTLPDRQLTVFSKSITTIKFMPLHMYHLSATKKMSDRCFRTVSKFSAICHLSGLKHLEIEMHEVNDSTVDKIIESFPKIRQICLGLLCPIPNQTAIDRLIQHLGKQHPIPVGAPPNTPLSVKWFIPEPIASDDESPSSHRPITRLLPNKKIHYPICPAKHIHRPVTRLRVTGTTTCNNAYVKVGPSTYYVTGTFSIDTDTVGGLVNKCGKVYGHNVLVHGCTGLTVSSDHHDAQMMGDKLIVVCDSAAVTLGVDISVVHVTQYMVAPLIRIDVYDTPAAAFCTVGMLSASAARSDGVVRLDAKSYNVARLRDHAICLHLPCESKAKASFYSYNVTNEDGSLVY